MWNLPLLARQGQNGGGTFEGVEIPGDYCNENSSQDFDR